MTRKLLLIDKNPAAFAPLAEHLHSIGFRLVTADEQMRADEQVMRVRPHAVLLRERNRQAREQIKANLRVSDVPIVMVSPARRKIKQNVEELQVALLTATLRRLR